MHTNADYGIAGHWVIKPLTYWIKYLAAPAFGITKTEYDGRILGERKMIFQKQVFVFTPKGDVVDLPKAVPVDFAYAVIPTWATNAPKPKWRQNPACNEALSGGDIVEIVINKNQRPSRDWLKFAKTQSPRQNPRKITTGWLINLNGFVN